MPKKAHHFNILVIALISFMLFFELIACNNKLVSQKKRPESLEHKNELPLKGFPDASLTIFPITWTYTGPWYRNPVFVYLVKRKIKHENQKLTETLGLMLEENGYKNFEMTKTNFLFPNEVWEDRASAFGKFVRKMDLKTEYALCTEFTIHWEKSFQRVFSVIVDTKGNIVWKDDQRTGNPEFDRYLPGTPEQCCEFLSTRLIPVIALDRQSEKKISADKKQTLRKMRLKQPPDKSERLAIARRLQKMKKIGHSARMIVSPTRAGGNYINHVSATRLSNLINKARLCQATARTTGPLLEGQGWSNEQHVLWLFARAARDYARKYPIDDDYILFADYWFTPSNNIWAVHFVICDRAGDWVIVDFQNNHHKDFQRINPKSLADCDRLVLERLIQYLR